MLKQGVGNFENRTHRRCVPWNLISASDLAIACLGRSEYGGKSDYY